MIALDVNALKRSIEYLNMVNSLELPDIVWTENGKPTDVNTKFNLALNNIRKVDPSGKDISNVEFLKMCIAKEIL